MTTTHRAPAPAVASRRRVGVNAEHPSYAWWVLSVTSLGMFLATVNSGTLLIALPDVERGLGTSLLTVVWVILAYMVASTVLMLPAGRLADQFGRRRLFIAGLAVFTIASLGAGFAGSGTALILWRILQGIGGAFVFANAGALVTDAFPRERLGLAMGTNTMVAAVGLVIGPVPPWRRGIASGTRTMLQNTGAVISIALMLMIVTAVVPTDLLFSIFSGLTTGLSADKLDPFMSGMHLALWILVAFSLAGAAVSALRGAQPVHATEPGPLPAARSAA